MLRRLYRGVILAYISCSFSLWLFFFFPYPNRQHLRHARHHPSLARPFIISKRLLVRRLYVYSPLCSGVMSDPKHLAGSGTECGQGTASANVTSTNLDIPLPMVGKPVSLWVEGEAMSCGLLVV